jgi:hypothetical protein
MRYTKKLAGVKGSWLALSLMSSTSALHAQKLIAIESKPSCTTCRFELTKLATLGGTAHPLAFDLLPNVIVNGEGTIFVLNYGRSRLEMFSKDGKFIRQIGREGKGPGEFQLIPSMELSAKDSLLVYDDLSFRITTINRKGEIVAATNGPAVRAWYRLKERLSDKEYFRPGSQDARRPALVDLSGRTIAAVGDWRMPWLITTRVSDSQAWIARWDEYAIHLWNRTGDTTVSLVRTADWFPEWSDADRTNGMNYWVPRKPMMRNMVVLPSGLLLVSVLMPRKLEAWEQEAIRPSRNERDPMSQVQRYDVRMEVVDPHTGKLLVSQLFPHQLEHANGEYFYSARETAEGEVFIDIWRLTFKR